MRYFLEQSKARKGGWWQDREMTQGRVARGDIMSLNVLSG